MSQSPNPNAPVDSPFQYVAPEGAAKTMSAVLGEIVWLTSQSRVHKSHLGPGVARRESDKQG
jgi:hypothetical protein